MTDEKEPKGPEAKAPPPAEKGSSFGLKLLEVIVAFVVILAAGALVSFSLRLGRAPWAWSSQDWQSFLSFSKEHVESAKERVQEIDWSQAKTKVTDTTKDLWSKLPDVERRIEERLGMKPAATPAPGMVPGASPAAQVPADNDELNVGLHLMHEGIEHYRASPQDQKELTDAKKCFEQAQAHLEKAAAQVKDERQRGEVQEDLRTCNRYLEDCRAREKG